MNRRQFLLSSAALTSAMLIGRAQAALEYHADKTAMAYISHVDCLKHDMGAHHPEQPARLLAIETALEQAGLLKRMQRFNAQKVTPAQLARVHTPAYIAHIFKSAPKTGLVQLDADTAMNPDSLEATLRASGAAIQGVDLVMQNAAKQVFCNTRPPGHHAGPANAAGFCIFNHVAVAAAHAMAQYGVARVAIIDFDVHHGDGTEAIFGDDARVMLCSSFRHPYYPHKGADSGNDHMLNAPLAAGSDGKVLREVFNLKWLPALTNFKPQLILFSAGFDAHAEDNMGGLAWQDEDYAWITQQVKTIANQHAQGRMVSVLEGGYALDALGRSAVAHVNAMMDN